MLVRATDLSLSPVSEMCDVSLGYSFSASVWSGRGIGGLWGPALGWMGAPRPASDLSALDLDLDLDRRVAFA